MGGHPVSSPKQAIIRLQLVMSPNEKKTIAAIRRMVGNRFRGEGY